MAASSVLFKLLSLVNGIGSLFAIFPLIGMMTNANGFLAGDSDIIMLAVALAFPTCFIASLALARSGQRLVGLLIAAIPVLMVAGVYLSIL